MTTQSKLTTSYVLSGVALLAGVGGIFYASKKGYGGWGKFGMFLLFGAPFSIASGAFSVSAQMNAVIEDNIIKENEQKLAQAKVELERSKLLRPSYSYYDDYDLDY